MLSHTERLEIENAALKQRLKDYKAEAQRREEELKKKHQSDLLRLEETYQALLLFDSAFRKNK